MNGRIRQKRVEESKGKVDIILKKEGSTRNERRRKLQNKQREENMSREKESYSDESEKSKSK
jgi:hypothetical protein